MKSNPAIHHRRSLRLRGYDYSQLGAYFLTICTREKWGVLGQVVKSTMVLNGPGQMVQQWFAALPRKFPTVELDCHVVMPNHVHAVARIVGAEPCVRPSQRPPTGNKGAHTGAPLHRVVQWFKTMTTNDCWRNVRQSRWPSLAGKLWQRNYYEHIVRDEDELNKIREYIPTNPLRWPQDRENPAVERDREEESPWM